MSLEEALYGSSNKLFIALTLIVMISAAGAIAGGTACYSAVSSIAVLAAIPGILAAQPRITTLAGDLGEV
jgi:hypothetical protein